MLPMNRIQIHLQFTNPKSPHVIGIRTKKRLFARALVQNHKDTSLAFKQRIHSADVTPRMKWHTQLIATMIIRPHTHLFPRTNRIKRLLSSGNISTAEVIHHKRKLTANSIPIAKLQSVIRFWKVTGINNKSRNSIQCSGLPNPTGKRSPFYLDNPKQPVGSAQTDNISTRPLVNTVLIYHPNKIVIQSKIMISILHQPKRLTRIRNLRGHLNHFMTRILFVRTNIRERHTRRKRSNQMRFNHIPDTTLQGIMNHAFSMTGAPRLMRKVLTLSARPAPLLNRQLTMAVLNDQSTFTGGATKVTLMPDGISNRDYSITTKRMQDFTAHTPSSWNRVKKV